MKRPRVRKWVKWVGTIAAGAAVAMAVSSRFYGCEHEATTKSGDVVWYTSIGEGLIQVDAFGGLSSTFWMPPRGWSIHRSKRWCWGYFGEMPYYGRVGNWHAGVLYGRDPAELRVGV